ncbi:MAG: M3 family metallopeptidase [Bacteriovoracaceae bacterium]|nr:M3 family metallopeptidase [Bacteriovoracaceae bacterium]
MNPLLSKFATPYETVPFNEIKNEHYLPALKESIELSKKDIEKIKNNSEAPTFENVLEAMNEVTDRLEKIDLVFNNQLVAETNEQLQKIAREYSPLRTEFSNDILLDGELFEKVKNIYDEKDALNIDQEQKMLLEKSYKAFVRNGALLSSADKERLRGIDKRISELSLEYGDHVLDETNKYELHITDEKELSGLPEMALEAAQMTAREKNKEGWVFTLQMPSLLSVVKYADNRELRKTIVEASSRKCMNGDSNDNQKILKEIACLRHERANLLGYETHSHFVLEERMAKDPGRVYEFTDDIFNFAKPYADRDMNELAQFSKSLGGPDEIQSWDYAYYAEKLKKEKFNIDDEILRPYFKLENVIGGVFEVAKRLYGLNFREVDNIPLYHPDVKTYEVNDSAGNFVAILYADFFPRSGKKGGAWMTLYRSQKGEIRPHVGIVCNFTKPTGTKPSLLSFGEVTTLFHEFGHALHGTLSNCKYASLSSPNVYWDFVELPSQIMENWVFEKDCLDLFAEHFQTGEKIPEEYIKRIKESSTFHEGRNTVRQLGLGLLDMEWHTKDPSNVKSVEEFEKEATLKMELCPHIEGSAISASFSHIFRGGYSSGYYSYKWAEVLDADAFEYFKENGIFNQEIAKKFQNEILSRGGTEHPSILYRRFRGRDPELGALLKRAGLKQNNA